MRSMTAIGLLAALAACQQSTPPTPTTTSSPTLAQQTPMPGPAAAPVSGSGEVADHPCGADKLDRWLNVLPTEDVKAAIAKAVGERPIRIYTQGDPITMDFSAARLNVELGVDGRIKLFRCG